jgi:hypothetical protein
MWFQKCPYLSRDVIRAMYVVSELHFTRFHTFPEKTEILAEGNSVKRYSRDVRGHRFSCDETPRDRIHFAVLKYLITYQWEHCPVLRSIAVQIFLQQFCRETPVAWRTKSWRPASRCHGPRSGMRRDPQNVEGIAGRNPGRAGCGLKLVDENLEGSVKFFFPILN